MSVVDLDSLRDHIKRNVRVDQGGCWLWQGRIDPDGYGRSAGYERTPMAHRISYEVFVGPIPDGLHIDHLCRVRSCINPLHLEPVTPRENALRGQTLAAANAIKTHCLRGHEFTPDNIRRVPRGRACKACDRIHSKNYRDRKAG